MEAERADRRHYAAGVSILAVGASGWIMSIVSSAVHKQTVKRPRTERCQGLRVLLFFRTESEADAARLFLFSSSGTEPTSSNPLLPQLLSITIPLQEYSNYLETSNRRGLALISEYFSAGASSNPCFFFTNQTETVKLESPPPMPSFPDTPLVRPRDDGLQLRYLPLHLYLGINPV